MSDSHDATTSTAAIAADREAFRVFLRDHNLPATAQRLAIADVVLGTDRHLSAEDVALFQSQLRRSQHESGSLIVQRGEPADALIMPQLGDLGALDYHRAAESIEEGRAAAKLMLPQIRQLLGS